jgi:hypothetical protein
MCPIGIKVGQFAYTVVSDTVHSSEGKIEVGNPKTAKIWTLFVKY